jgi:N-acyl homoserine lactone hydrolase
MLENMGSPQRLYLLQVMTSTMPTATGSLAMSAGCYLVQTSTGQHILIDTGLPANHASPAGMPPVESEKNVLEHLTDLGLSPSDINVVVSTHFDIDHVGHHPSFPQAQFIVQHEHYELARSGHPRFSTSRLYWDDPALQYRFVDGDTDLFAGFRLITTPGHVPAHQSVLLDLPQTGPVLLAIDAVVMEHLFTVDRVAWPIDDDETQLRASTKKLLDLRESEHVALVVFGHDGQQWQTLKKAPAYYD